MTSRRVWVRWGLLAALVVLAGEQAWRHGHDYILAEQFATIEPGKIYRGAWQKPWPMRRIVHDYHIKTVIALAHPPTHPLAIREHALAGKLGFQWIHIPIADERALNDWRVIYDHLDEAAATVADPKNQPVFFHCHHGINRASMVQMAYRMKYCGWTLDQATAEISHSFGLVEVSQGPDYRYMEGYYAERILPARKAPATAAAPQPIDPPTKRF